MFIHVRLMMAAPQAHTPAVTRPPGVSTRAITSGSTTSPGGLRQVGSLPGGVLLCSFMAGPSRVPVPLFAARLHVPTRAQGMFV